MKGPILFLVFSAFFIVSSAQKGEDPAGKHYDPSAVKDNSDSIDQRVSSRGDTGLPSLQKIDSIRNDFNVAAHTLQRQYQNAITKIDGDISKLNQSMDSLRQLDLRRNRYTKSLDSLKHLRQTTKSRFTSRFNDLKAKTSGKLDALDVPPEYKEPLKRLANNLDALSFNSDAIKIPPLKISGYALPGINGIGDLAPKAGEIGKMPNLGKLPGTEARVGDLGGITKAVTGYEDDIKSITQGSMPDVQAIPGTIEEQAAQIDGMEELQKQSAVLNEHKALLDGVKDSGKAKEKVVETVKKAAVDHFAGKHEQLKAAMEKISKYKQKYSSATSIKNLPKRPPNAMKGKALVERLTPGLYFQYQQKNFYLLDVNPYLGYRISGRFTAGLGWNHRYTYDRDSRSFSSQTRIFGPRGYLDSKVGRGFIAHLEGETMNAFVPSTLIGNPDTGKREWVWSFMTGLKKEYKIYRNLKGTALIQYNWLNRYYKAPYVDRLNSRIGFEYTLRRPPKKKSNTQ